MNLFFLKKDRADDAIGFEPEEQKTPVLGRVLLILLAIVLLFFGWQGLSDLGRIPRQPARLSECSGFYYNIGRVEHIRQLDRGIYSEYNYRNDQSMPRTCVFSVHEQKAGVSTAYQDAQNAWLELDNYDRSIVQSIQNQVNNLDVQIMRKQKEYDLSLQELQAGQPAVGKTPEQLRAELQDLQDKKQQAAAALAQAQAKLASYENILKEKEAILINKINQAIDLSNKAWSRYKFWVFLLEMLFVLPFFLVSLWVYFKLLNKNSPHTIILLPIVFVGAVLFARSLIIYFWAFFLADLIMWLFALAETLLILRTLLFYFGMLLSIIVFGGAVYLLQKKIYAPARVRLRRLKTNKCPSCEAPMDFAKNFCAACGKPIVEKCPSCGQDKFIDFKHCPHCGN